MHKSFKSRNMGSGHFVPTSVMHVIRGLWASRSSKNCYVRLWARLLKLKLSICVIRFWSEGADRRAVYNGRVRTYLFGPCRRHGWTTQGWPTGLLNFQFTLFNFAHPFCAYHIVSTGNVPPTSVFILRFLYLWMQVKFHYIGYNENGRRVDSSYQQGQPARTRLGVKGMIPGTFLLLNFQFNCLSSSRDLLPRHQIVRSYIRMNRDRDARAREPGLWLQDGCMQVLKKVSKLCAQVANGGWSSLLNLGPR